MDGLGEGKKEARVRIGRDVLLGTGKNEAGVGIGKEELLRDGKNQAGEGKNKIGGSVNTVTGGERSLTVVNYPEGRLPLSGLAGSLQVLLAGVLLLGVAVGVTLFERKK